ncbi:uncharacterized protein LOC124434647 [Xenia sp. Carnegie-2017]|uniref:uncharacterized protein LOC124434647 n=1 Tax=Xenia sp. Carnegie-2017 TaxID=2897299 RepID=UPI001F03E81C|nr:uncharacterized protein LOC124434647 [Xenia sp. Carnegie-2017]
MLFFVRGSYSCNKIFLLLCAHSLLLGMLPRIVKLVVPMVELVLFIVLLFLPINITPPLAVWMYEKLLYISSPFLSAFEAIHVVLLIMNTSQKVVNEMEENPFIVKSLILGVAAFSTLLGFILSHHICSSYPRYSIIKIVELLVIVSVILFVLTLFKDEGIINEVPCLFFVMMCIVWALANESSLSKTKIKLHTLWLSEIPNQPSILNAFRTVASNGLARPFYQIKSLFFHLISPSLLLMTGVRIVSLGYIVSETERKLKQSPDDSDFDDQEYDSDFDDEDEYLNTNNVYFSRVLVIFVLTEFFLRAMFTVTSASFTSSYPSNETFTALRELEDWWRETDIAKSFLDFRIIRIVQLCLLVVVYVYKLFFRDDVINDDGW